MEPNDLWFSIYLMGGVVTCITLLIVISRKEQEIQGYAALGIFWLSLIWPITLFAAIVLATSLGLAWLAITVLD